MQPRVGEFHLRLHSNDACDPAAHRRGTPSRQLEQSRLADTRLTADHQDAASSGHDNVDELVQSALLDLSTEQGRHASARPGPISLSDHLC
jgi:hypothetical protein